MRPFTRSTEYAIRALTYLAIHKQGDRFHLAREMSEVLGIPAPFLGKILQPLVMRGILESQRGRNGGFRLIGDPNQVTLMQIADSQELIYENRQCILGEAECTDEHACPMHEYWKGASAEFEESMNTSTLTDLMGFCAQNGDSGYPYAESPENGSQPPSSSGGLIKTTREGGLSD